MAYQPPVRDHVFLLRDVLEIDRYSNLPAFADAAAHLERAITAVEWTGASERAATLHLRLAQAAYRIGDMAARQGVGCRAGKGWRRLIGTAGSGTAAVVAGFGSLAHG